VPGWRPEAETAQPLQPALEPRRPRPVYKGELLTMPFPLGHQGVGEISPPWPSVSRRPPRAHATPSAAARAVATAAGRRRGRASASPRTTSTTAPRATSSRGNASYRRGGPARCALRGGTPDGDRAAPRPHVRGGGERTPQRGAVLEPVGRGFANTAPPPHQPTGTPGDTSGGAASYSANATTAESLSAENGRRPVSA